MVRVINKLWKLSGRKYRLSLSIHSNLLNIKCNLISVNIRIFYFPSVQCNKHRPSINESENRKRKKKIALQSLATSQNKHFDITRECDWRLFWFFVLCFSRCHTNCLAGSQSIAKNMCIFFYFRHKPTQRRRGSVLKVRANRILTIIVQL